MNLKTRANFVDLINEKKYRIGAEIGVRSGAYSKYLIENSNLTILFSIDPWEKIQSFVMELKPCMQPLVKI